MSHEVLLTKEGCEKLKAELAHLKGSERQRIAEVIREARSHGDLRENAMYHEAKLNQRRLEARIADLERTLQMAKIVERTGEAGAAHLDSMVTLKDKEFGDTFTIELVGEFEADPTQDKVSITSPLGKAIINAKAGDEVEVEAPAGVQRFEVVSVE